MNFEHLNLRKSSRFIGCNDLSIVEQKNSERSFEQRAPIPIFTLKSFFLIHPHTFSKTLTLHRNSMFSPIPRKCFLFMHLQKIWSTSTSRFFASISSCPQKYSLELCFFSSSWENSRWSRLSGSGSWFCACSWWVHFFVCNVFCSFDSEHAGQQLAACRNKSDLLSVFQNAASTHQWTELYSFGRLHPKYRIKNVIIPLP